LKFKAHAELSKVVNAFVVSRLKVANALVADVALRSSRDVVEAPSISNDLADVADATEPIPTFPEESMIKRGKLFVKKFILWFEIVPKDTISEEINAPNCVVLRVILKEFPVESTISSL
jgi:hypothetical protein